jgi:hypothetical protein
VRFGYYARIDGNEAEVFLFDKDHTYLFVLAKQGRDEPAFTLKGLRVITKWFTKQSYPGAPTPAGQVKGTYQLSGSSMRFTRIPWYGDRPIDYNGTVGKTDTITFDTLDHNNGSRAKVTFTRIA